MTTGSSAKVVVCGWHRTGTTSLHVALDALGYSVRGFDRDLCEQVMQGRAQPMWDVADTAEAFRDFPWTLYFAAFDARYPGSRFILTRRDPDDWLESYRRHDARWPGNRFHGWLYGRDSLAGNEKVFVDRYAGHNRAVRAHFRGRQDLLLFDVFRGDGWEELCGFLQKRVPERPFPSEKSAIL